MPQGTTGLCFSYIHLVCWVNEFKRTLLTCKYATTFVQDWQINCTMVLENVDLKKNHDSIMKLHISFFQQVGEIEMEYYLSLFQNAILKMMINTLRTWAKYLCTWLQHEGRSIITPYVYTFWEKYQRQTSQIFESDFANCPNFVLCLQYVISVSSGQVGLYVTLWLFLVRPVSK